MRGGVADILADIHNWNVRISEFRNLGTCIGNLGMAENAETRRFHRSAAVMLQGTKDVKVESCLFKRLDGNAVLLNRYVESEAGAPLYLMRVWRTILTLN